MADAASRKPVDGDTLFMLSSTTKGVTATCMHLCVEKHKLSYDMPIVEVWPEFGAHGSPTTTGLRVRCSEEDQIEHSEEQRFLQHPIRRVVPLFDTPAVGLHDVHVLGERAQHALLVADLVR